MHEELRSKFEGTVIGAAIGAALGKTVHNIPKEEVHSFYGKPITDFIRPHPSTPYDFLLPEEVPAEVELLRLLLESLVTNQTFDPYDFAFRVVKWLTETKVHKYLNPAILNTLRALAAGEELQEVYQKSSSIDTVLHTVALGLFHYDYPTLAAEAAKIAALIFAKGKDIEDGAQIVGATTSLLVGGEYDLGEQEEKFKFLHEVVDVCSELTVAPKYLSKVEEALKRNLKPEEAINFFGNGEYIWESLPLSLYLFLRDVSYPQRAFLNAVNAYGDYGGATAAIGFLVGAWIGAYWGIEIFPPEWIKKVEHSTKLIELADKLFEIVTQS